jgi:Xaa-Pro aminopeptidase
METTPAKNVSTPPTALAAPPAAPEYEARLERVRARLQDAGIAYCFVGPSSDLHYLTGLSMHSSERMALLVVAAQGASTLVVPAFEAVGLSSLPAGLAVQPWQETEDPAQLVATVVAAPDGTASGDLPVVVGDQLWAVFLLRLQAAIPRAVFSTAARVLEPVRAVKDGQEVARLAEAGAAADAVFTEIGQLRFLGQTERQVAAAIADLLRRRGLTIEWGPIVGSGPNGASPHHGAGDRVIEEGDLVVLDYGGRLNGYNADITRTVAVGREPSAEMRKVYDLVYEGQERAVQAARPGITGEQLDAVARDYFAAAGYGAYFLHRLGHGIGLDGHEPPYLVQGNNVPLMAGNAVTIEPGLYLRGQFGVRIEDTVVLTAEGAQRMNNAPRELMIVH